MSTTEAQKLGIQRLNFDPVLHYLTAFGVPLLGEDVFLLV